MNLSSAKLNGSPGVSGWAQVHEFLPQDEEKVSTRGHLFAVISTKKQIEGLDAVTAGREILTRLHEEYFGELVTTPFNALKRSVEKITQEFKESMGEVEIAAISFVGGVIYSAASGGASVSLFRNGLLATLLQSGEGAVTTASGYPKEGDMLVLATSSFFKVFTQGELQASFSSGNPNEAVEQLAPNIHSREDLGDLSMVLVKFEAETSPSFVPSSQAEIEPKSTPVPMKKRFLGVFEKLTKKLPERRIFVKSGVSDEADSKGKKTALLVGTILLVLLVVSIVFGIRQKGINDKKAMYEETLTAAEQEMEEAINLAPLDKKRSRELFSLSKSKLDELLLREIKDKRIDALKEKVDANKGSILGEYEANPETFLDLELLSSGLSGEMATTSNETFFILDTDGKKVVSVEIATKKAKVIAGPDDVAGASQIAAYESRAFVLKENGVYEVDSGGATEVLTKDWEGDSLIASYTGNLYVLSKNENSISRYSGSGDTFGSSQSWLAESTTANFSNAFSWVIDGNIWVLTSTSKIARFSLGNPISFNMEPTSPAVTKIDAIYTNEELKGVYLLDREGKRVIAYDKEGNLLAQYVADAISEATHITVSEEEKKIILLAGSKLYSIELKH